MTSIEWTQQTWNPLVGCSKISAGCQNCYAINQAYRNDAMGQKLDNPGRLAYYDGLTEKHGNRVEWTGVVRFVPEALEIPLRRKKPTTWFVNSMSDLFHESVTDEQLDQIFAVMALTPHHTYQVLTKRPERMVEYFSATVETLHTRWSEAAIQINAWEDIGKLSAWTAIVNAGFPLPNVWLGVTVENQKTADERIPLLLQTPAAVRFLSCEPLLEGVDISEFLSSDSGFWVIAGGESGPNARPCNIAWIRSIVQQCADADVPCFVKQLGSKPNWPISGKGNNMEDWPQDLQVRQMPKAA